MVARRGCVCAGIDLACKLEERLRVALEILHVKHCLLWNEGIQTNCSLTNIYEPRDMEGLDIVLSKLHRYLQQNESQGYHKIQISTALLVFKSTLSQTYWQFITTEENSGTNTITLAKTQPHTNSCSGENYNLARLVNKLNDIIQAFDWRSLLDPPCEISIFYRA